MKFIKYRDRSKEHRWQLVASNGRVIADSAEGYQRRGDRDRALERVREGASADQIVELKGDRVAP